MHGYLTFDVGTTAVKSCLFDDDLRLLSIANEEYTLDTDAGGRVELDPERYWQAVCGGAAEALRRAQLPPSASQRDLHHNAGRNADPNRKRRPRAAQGDRLAG